MKKLIEVNEPIYNTKVVLYTDCTIEDFIKSASKKFHIDLEEEDLDKEFNGRVFHCKYNRHLVWIDNSKHLDILVHELYHVVSDVSQFVNLDSEEGEAYLLTFLFSSIVDKLKNSKKKTPKKK